MFEPLKMKNENAIISLTTIMVIIVICSSGCSNVFFILNPYKIKNIKITSANYEYDTNVFNSYIYNAKGSIEVEFTKQPSQSEIDNMSKEIGVSMYVKGDTVPKYYLQVTFTIKGKHPSLYTLGITRISFGNNWRSSISDRIYTAEWEFNGYLPLGEGNYKLYAVSSNKYELEKLRKEKWYFLTEVLILPGAFGSPAAQESDDIPKHLYISDPYKLQRN